jgi:hypothetical protein
MPMNLMLPEFLPDVEWFINAAQNKQFNIALNCNFNQSKFLNKYNIPGPNQLQTLVVPILAHTKNGMYSDVLIDYTQKWIREHKNALQTAYGKSPFFEYYDYRIFNVLDQEIPDLNTLNITLLRDICKWVGLDHLPMNIHENSENAQFTQINKLNVPEYNQVFHEKFGFRPNVSIVDLLFNQGPLAKSYFENSF